MEDKKLEIDQGGGSKGKVLVNIDEKRDTQKATKWTGNRKMSKKNGKINNRVCFKMINIQGLTKAKYVEIEDMLNDKENNMNIIVMTETQQKIDKINPSKGAKTIMTMREEKDKKGGGLMVIYKEEKELELVKLDTNSKDILDIKGKIYDIDTRIMIVYMDCASDREGKERNIRIREELERKIEEIGDQEALIIMGDFNCHLGFLGYQEENENGKRTIEFINNNNLILLNIDDKCQGTYTWGRGNQKSAIDLMIVNNIMYNYFEKMEVDEEKEKIDISDHNLIQMKIKVDRETKSFKGGVWEEYEYFKTDEKKLKEYREEVKSMLRREDINRMENFDRIVEVAAKEKLKTKCRRKKIDSENYKIEPKWINESIREEIKKRKELNRQKRNLVGEEKERVNQMYLKQKEKASRAIKEALLVHETRKSKEAKADRNKIFKFIDDIRGKKKLNEDIQIYNDDGIKMSKSETEKEIGKFWGEKIYKMHENRINEVWGEDERKSYEEEIDRENRERNIREQLREHLDMAFPIEKIIRPMREPSITEKKVKSCLKRLKNKKAAGPDGLKSELYKTLGEDEECLKVLTKCLKNEVEIKEKPQKWKQSKTKMMKKVKELRPIALTNMSYKIFMSLVKNEIEEHLESNGEMKETQAGFTTGGRVEDNLLILQYCVEEIYKKKKNLIVISIDFKKAYDSIKREKIIEVMKEYKIHKKLIDTTGEIYKGDTTKINIGYDLERELEVTSGIKQGCTGSTTIFKLITYKIMKKLEREGKGFKNENIKIESLFFADDGLIMATSIEEAKENIKALIEVCGDCGLEINKDKSNIIIFNMKDKPAEIEGIKVTESIKYLGLEIEGKRNMFAKQKKNMIRKAEKLANMAYSVIAKSCHKVIIGKTYWKNIALPAILYGTAVMNITETEIKKLQRIENGVGRKILGAPKYAAVATLRGELGMSEMRSRIAGARLRYVKGIEEGKNELLKKIVEVTKEDERNKWMKETKRCMKEIGVNERNFWRMEKKEIKNKEREMDSKRWEEEIKRKTSLEIYNEEKKEIKEEIMYDNRPSSVIMYRARTNCLRLNDRKRHQGGEIKCKLCGAEEENLEHFLLECDSLKEERKMIKELQRPYIENRKKIIGTVLFQEEGIENRKENIYRMWRKREKELKEKT